MVVLTAVVSCWPAFAGFRAIVITYLDETFYGRLEPTGEDEIVPGPLRAPVARMW